jgi:lysophospholipase L1-like esterase
LVAGAIENRSGRSTEADNLARGGLTTADVRSQLDDPGIAADVADADVLIVTVGANDLDDAGLAGPSDVPVVERPTYRHAMAHQREDLNALLGRVAALRGGSHGRVLVTGYWNVFLDGPAGRDRGPDYVMGSNAVTVADNAIIAEIVAAHGDEYVDLYTPFKGADGHQVATALLAADGDHPSAAGHRLIAETVLGVLFGPGR